MQTQTELRKLCRQQRNALSFEQQRLHETQATQQFLRLPMVQRATRIAIFLATDGELRTDWLISRLWQQSKQLYLPVLTEFKRHPMQFAAFTPKTFLKKNQFGIAEPICHRKQLLFGHQMDLVLTPLACFDENGNRIGMGGGYYDRSFAFKKMDFHARPKLIGWAHQCQQVKLLNKQPWDVPLDALITEKNTYLF